MLWSKKNAISASATLLLATSVYLYAGPGEGERVVPQYIRGVALPVWGQNEMRGNIDIRIWPDDMVLWLERENLRRMARDPNRPKEERDGLKQLLARQLGWGRRWVGE